MVQNYQNIYIQAYVLCISEQKLDRHLEGKAACYKNLRSAPHLFLYVRTYESLSFLSCWGEGGILTGCETRRLELLTISWRLSRVTGVLS